MKMILYLLIFSFCTRAFCLDITSISANCYPNKDYHYFHEDDFILIENNSIEFWNNNIFQKMEHIGNSKYAGIKGTRIPFIVKIILDKNGLKAYAYNDETIDLICYRN